MNSLVFSLASAAIMICVCAIACFWEHRKYQTAVVKTEKDSVTQYLDKKGADDLSAAIVGVVFFFVIIFIVAVVAIAGMRLIGKRITEQLNTIADDIDKKWRPSSSGKWQWRCR